MTRRLIPLLLLLFAFPAAAFAEAPVGTKKTKANAKEVASTLRTHLAGAAGAEWKEFQLRVVYRIGGSEYATAAGWELWADGTQTPYIAITRAYLRLYGDNRDALAVLLGREFGTLMLGRAPRNGATTVRLGGVCDDRRRQADRDLFAGELLLKSGYSLRAGVAGLRRELPKIPAGARPELVERLTRLTRLFDPSESLGVLMPAFDAGLTFRAAMRYWPAEVCFAFVLNEHPHYRDAAALLAASRFMRFHACLVHERLGAKPLAVSLLNGMAVSVGEDPDEMISKLGQPTRTTPLVPGTALKRFRFTQHGIDVFADEESLVIVLTARGPRVNWPMGGKPAGTLRVGMTRKQVESLPGGSDFATRPFGPSRPEVCAYHPALGVAVVYDRAGADAAVVAVIVSAAGH